MRLKYYVTLWSFSITKTGERIKNRAPDATLGPWFDMRRAELERETLAALNPGKVAYVWSCDSPLGRQS